MTNPNILYPFIYPKMVKETVFLKNCISNPNIIIGDILIIMITPTQKDLRKKMSGTAFFVN